VLLVATARDTAVRVGIEANQLLAKVAREAEPIALGRLGRADLAQWINSAATSLAPSVDRVLSISEGNPLFVAELLAAAHKRGDQAWSSTHALPLGIREAIRAHVSMLSLSTQHALEAASVLGRELSITAITALVGDARDAIDEAIASAILAPVEPVGDPDRAHGRVRFTHILIRDEIYARLGIDRRADLHRAVAADEPDPATAAFHWLLGARRDDVDPAIAAVDAAMRDALARCAFDDAALLGARALTDLAEYLSAAQSCALGIAVGEESVLAGDLAAARAAGLATVAEARGIAATDPTHGAELLARAALVHAIEATVGQRDNVSVSLLREALAAQGERDSPMRAQVMARLSTALLPAPPAEHDEAL